MKTIVMLTACMFIFGCASTKQLKVKALADPGTRNYSFGVLGFLD